MNGTCIGFGVTALLCVAAALLPVFRGRPVNGVFLAAGMLFCIVGLVAFRRRPAPPRAGD